MPHSRIEVIKFRVLLFPLLLCLSCTASAQVYKSTDAEGNVTYSDIPSTDNEAVQIQKTNVADPVKLPENTTTTITPAPEPTVTAQEAPPEDEIFVDDDDDYNYRNRLRAAKRLAQRHKSERRSR